MRQRPMSVLIFGILNIGFGLWQLVAAPLLTMFSAKVQSAMAKSNANSPFLAIQSDPTFAAMTKYKLEVDAVLGVAMLAFGIGLLLVKNWARLGSIFYAFIKIVEVLILAMVSYPITARMLQQVPNMSPSIAQVTALVGLAFQLILGMAYPALLLFFMTRDNVMEACQAEQEQPTSPPPPPVQEAG